jgi:hypothetical protein
MDHPPLGNAAKVISEPGTGRSRGFGAVMYYNESDALAAYKGMHGVELEGRFLYVDRYRDGQERDRAAYRAAGYDRPYEGSRRGPTDSAAPYGTSQALTAHSCGLCEMPICKSHALRDLTFALPPKVGMATSVTTNLGAATIAAVMTGNPPSGTPIAHSTRRLHSPSNRLSDLNLYQNAVRCARRGRLPRERRRLWRLRREGRGRTSRRLRRATASRRLPRCARRLRRRRPRWGAPHAATLRRRRSRRLRRLRPLLRRTRRRCAVRSHPPHSPCVVCRASACSMALTLVVVAWRTEAGTMRGWTTTARLPTVGDAEPLRPAATRRSTRPTAGALGPTTTRPPPAAPTPAPGPMTGEFTTTTTTFSSMATCHHQY